MRQIENEIEKLMDNYGIEKFLNALSFVCFEKADHVLSNYGDQQLATNWKFVGKKISNVMYKGK